MHRKYELHIKMCNISYAIDKKEYLFMKTEDFCAFLKDVRVSSGVSITDLSKKYGWHRNTIGSYEKDRLCDVDYLLALSREGDVSLNTLLTERVKSGVLQDVTEFNSPEFKFSDLLEYEQESREGVEYFRVQTKQYEPTIQEGSIAEVDTRNIEPLSNRIIAFRNERREVSVCRVVEMDQSLFLLSMVPGPKLIKFDPKDYDILGIVMSTKLIFNSESGN